MPYEKYMSMPSPPPQKHTTLATLFSVKFWKNCVLVKLVYMYYFLTEEPLLNFQARALPWNRQAFLWMQGIRPMEYDFPAPPLPVAIPKCSPNQALLSPRNWILGGILAPAEITSLFENLLCSGYTVLWPVFSHNRCAFSG